MSRNIKGLTSNVIHRITAVLNENLEQRNSEFLISEFILKNIDLVSEMGIEDLAENSYTSASTVSRFIKKLGYKNYLQFKKELNGFKEFRESEFRMKHLSNEQIIDSVFETSVNALKQMQEELDYDQLMRIVNAIHEAKDIYVFGVDYSQIVIQDLQLRFINNQKVILTHVLTNENINLISSICEKSLVIFVSSSGNNKKLLDIQSNLNENVMQVLLSENITGDLAENIDELVLLPTREDDLVATALSERQVISSIFDIIYLLYANTFQK